MLARTRIAFVVTLAGLATLAIDACTEDDGAPAPVIVDASLDVRTGDSSSTDTGLPEASQPDASAFDGDVLDAGQDGGNDAGLDASVDAADAADGAPNCTTSLANVGLGDFRITFDVDLNTTALQQTVLAQRAACIGGCTPSANFWHLRLSSAGRLGSELCSDGGTQTLLSDPLFRADAGVQHVVIQRISGVMSVTVGGADAGTLLSIKHLDGLQSAALCQATGCACEPSDPNFQDGTQPLDGMLTNVCLEKL